MVHPRNGWERRQSTTGQLLVIGLLSPWLGTHVTGLITRYLIFIGCGTAEWKMTPVTCPQNGRASTISPYDSIVAFGLRG